MLNKNNIPQIRFSNFTDVWEQRKLGDICSLITKGTTPKDKSGNGEVNFIKVENINSDNGEISGLSKISLEEHEGYLKRSQLHENDILFSIAGTLGRVSVVNSSVLPANTNQALAIIRTKEGSISYLTTALKGNVVEEFIRRNPTVGAQPNLSLEQVANLIIPYPCYEEQEVIGEYFDRLDNLITLHQRKYDKLLLVKKSMLEKMFPQKGESIPQIRFAGFTEAWEQRKFVDCFDYLQNNSLSRAELSDGDGEILNVHYGDILVKFGEVIDLETDTLPIIIDSSILNKYSNSILMDGDVVIADAAEDETVGKCSEIKGCEGKKVLAGLHTIPVRPKVKYANGFLGYFMNSAAYHDQLLPLMQGTKVSSISKTAIQDTLLNIPYDIEEQKRIADYFMGLDRLITLHQRKLDKLKNIKKSMLEKMFVEL